MAARRCGRRADHSLSSRIRRPPRRGPCLRPQHHRCCGGWSGPGRGRCHPGSAGTGDGHGDARRGGRRGQDSPAGGWSVRRRRRRPRAPCASCLRRSPASRARPSWVHPKPCDVSCAACSHSAASTTRQRDRWGRRWSLKSKATSRECSRPARRRPRVPPTCACRSAIRPCGAR